MCKRVTVVLLGVCFLLSLAPALLQAQHFQRIPLEVPGNGRPGFTLLAAENTGVFFTNSIPEERFRTNQMLLNGSGVAAGDVDGDGLCDLYFAAVTGSNALYRNLGNWKFQDITAQAGVGLPDRHSAGTALVDLDGDADLDLLVSTIGHGLHIFLNDGKGRFQDISANPPLNLRRGGTSLAFGDLNGDGRLDIYAVNYRASALVDMFGTRFTYKMINGKQTVTTVNGRPVSDPEYADRYVVTPKGGIEELGEPDAIFLNLGPTKFVPLSFTNGSFLDEAGQPLAKPPLDWGLSAVIRDINQDGLPDIYVCNDFNSPDRMWLNQGKGTFRAAPKLAMRKGTMFSMGVDFGDLNRDGWDDFMVLDMLSRDRTIRLTGMPDANAPVTGIGQMDNRPEYMMNTLFINRGDGTYAETAQFSGVAASEWSWTPLFMDVDLDGWEDILICNGYERDARNMDIRDRLRAMRAEKQMSLSEILGARKIFPRLATPNVAFRNRRDLTFEDASKNWGFDDVGVSHGMAHADLDKDGDLDVVLANVNSLVGLYRNNASAPRLAVRLKGRAPNTSGLGARIQVFGGPVLQSQEMMAGGRYLSSDAPMRVFATGSLTNRLTIEVTWPGGFRTVMTNAEPNSLYEISQVNTARKSPDQASHSQVPPLFEDATGRLGHTHTEESFDDFARQPLLPNKLSQPGPGIAWCDLDHDGREDLVIGSGRGGKLSLLRNDGKGGFHPAEDLGDVSTRDQTGLISWQRGPGDIVVLAGSSNYEDGMAAGAGIRQYERKTKAVLDAVPASESSTGPLAMADVDGDGTLELFVGGRVLPGRYPEPASSALLRYQGGSWKPDRENTSTFAKVGLVSGATFTDLDADADPDLVLACEWGPVRVFRNTSGQFQEATQSLGLDKFTGWWTSVAAGDLDGDGRMDLVAGNWGRNTRYEIRRAKPLRIYFGNIPSAEPGTIIEVHYEPSLQRYAPEQGMDALLKVCPWLKEKFPTYASYSKASLEEIWGPDLQKATLLEANHLDSTIFLNRGDSFEARPLPTAAQLSPVFGLCVADLDGDGSEDIFLAQNFFAVQPETPRYDAGLGLVLKGDGKGNFSALSPQHSGIRIHGEQRGSALGDYDADGRVDLAVGQNGGQTRLYRNAGATPGVRVRLSGPPGNPAAVGAQLRFVSPERSGPMREIRAGSGYLSQDSFIQVMARPGPTAQLAIRWPGGKETKVQVPPHTREVSVAPDGQFRFQD